jgi:hypothetical protein
MLCFDDLTTCRRQRLAHRRIGKSTRSEFPQESAEVSLLYLGRRKTCFIITYPFTEAKAGEQGC